jgi:C4-dicarboxylate transporter/malic acid transport protein
MTVSMMPLTQVAHPREVVRQFTPNWFTATMGTGILALTIAQFPLATPVLWNVGAALWMLNIALFATCSALLLGRAIFFWPAFVRLFGHPVQSMFLGAIPMGLATIVNGCVTFGGPIFGPQAVSVATSLWVVDVALALISGWLVPYLMFSRQSHRIESMTAVWLLPIVPAEVAAASGALLAPHLDVTHAQLVLGSSVVLWTLSVPLALGILSILFMRLALHNIPPSDMAVSGWLTLGPLGTGALAMLLMGSDATQILAGTALAPLSAVVHGVALFTGLLLWGYGAWWWVMAIIMTIHHARTSLPFNMGWWAFTFPLGVYTAATFALGRELQAPQFTTLAAAFVVLLAAFWVTVTARTAHGAWQGYLFRAPCLSGETALPENVLSIRSRPELHPTA